MPFETTRDLLEHLREYHRELSTCYAEIAESTEQGKVKMLLHYLGRHESRFEEIIADCEEEAAVQVLDTWFSFTPDKLPALDKTALKPGMSTDEIVEAALHYDDILLTFCRQVASEAVSDDVRELFRGLIELEEHEERQLVQAAAIEG